MRNIFPVIHISDSESSKVSRIFDTVNVRDFLLMLRFFMSFSLFNPNKTQWLLSFFFFNLWGFKIESFILKLSNDFFYVWKSSFNFWNLSFWLFCFQGHDTLYKSIIIISQITVCLIYEFFDFTMVQNL